MLVVAIDANCATYASAQRMVEDCLNDEWKASVVKATPDPHVERWYLADAEAFHEVVGIAPSVTQDKCERDYYKSVLARAIVDAGHPPTLGGLEFARELVEAMDFYRAGKADSSLKHFIEEARNRLQTLNA